MNVEQAAEYLAASTDRVYDLRRQGLPHFKDGSRLLFKREDLDAWLTRNGGHSRFARSLTQPKRGNPLPDTQTADGRPQKRARPKSRYSDTEVEHGLVWPWPSTAATVDALARPSSVEGLNVPETTLRRWRDTQHSDWYAQVQAKVMPRIRELAAERHSELADLEGEAARKLLSRLIDEYEDVQCVTYPAPSAT